MSNITIQEDFTLPSLGKIYEQQFDPTVRLRSMTVAEEMKRLTATESPYKTMSDIIEACLETKLPISVYDMCLGDYQYLLHKLRVVTYGPDYKISVICPFCGHIYEEAINLDELGITEYDDSINSLKLVKLPITGKTIELDFQTPRDLDEIDKQKKLLKKKFPDMTDDPTLMLNMKSMIKTVDGEFIMPALLEGFIKKLPMKDFNILLNKAEQLNMKVGIDIAVDSVCPECLNDVKSTFRFTSEFFRPKVD